MLVVLSLAVFAAVVGFGVGCSSNDDTPSGTVTSFYGSYTEQTGAGGTISLSGLGAATSSVSRLGSTGTTIDVAGELHVGTQVITLVGFYYSDKGYLSFTSDDGAYNFGGNVTNGIAAGASFGPNGSGSFMLFLGGSSSNVAAYCTNATCTSPVDCQATGTFNISVSGSVALLTVNYSGQVAFGAGTATASAVDFHLAQAGQFDATIHGDISGTSMTGTWSEALSQYAGDFSGSTAQCTAPPVRFRR